MDAGEDQNTGTTNGNPQTSGNSRAPQIAHMSLYERQAVQVCINDCIDVMKRLMFCYLELIIIYKDFLISLKTTSVSVCFFV